MISSFFQSILISLFGCILRMFLEKAKKYATIQKIYVLRAGVYALIISKGNSNDVRCTSDNFSRRKILPM